MKIAMYDLEGHFLEILEGETYQDIIDMLPKKCGITAISQLQKVVNGYRNYTGIYQFKEVNVKHLQRIGSCVDLNTGLNKPVHKYYKGRYISSYKSISKASLMCGIDERSIGKCCNGGISTAGGFNWYYASLVIDKEK